MKLQHSIHASFAAVAATRFAQVAVVDDDGHLTYGELDRRSDEIARYLRQHGITRGSRVGLFSQRSLESIAALLGILKAGGVYVPFDPSYPPKLLKFVYEDCSPTVMLIQSSLAVPGAESFWDGEGHDLHTVYTGRETREHPEPLPQIGPEDAAYIMYTSGSTGQPKGVLIPHRGVIRLVTENSYAAMGPDQVHLQLAPLAFDASTFEIWGALLNGARLAVLPAPYPSLDDVASAIARHQVTTLWLTAGLFHLMVDHRLDGLLPLRQLLAGGDVLSPSHVAKAHRGLPDCQLINGYGPTENTTFTCCYRIPRDVTAAAAIPIGTAIAHTQVHVLDESLGPVADGQEGELFAGGAGLALGYWNRPDLTAERFIPDPADPARVARLYRTGDRVRRRADGNLEFLGRVDRQVKLNGKRVELDEIEACLRRGPAVEDAAVICPPADAGTRKVHAFVTFRAPDALATAELRRFLTEELPSYMVPATLTVMAALPLSPTGKVDRTRLPLPPHAGVAVPASGNGLEAVLSGIWRKVLGVDSIGYDDNFFDLGGTSLQLIAVHARITEAMHNDVTVVDLFQYSSIGALAARLRRGSAALPGVDGAFLNADDRARRQRAALLRARANPRRSAH